MGTLVYNTGSGWKKEAIDTLVFVVAHHAGMKNPQLLPANWYPEETGIEMPVEDANAINCHLFAKWWGYEENMEDRSVAERYELD